MNEDKDFFKQCFDTVAGLNVENESQEIAKEVVLSEIENLQQENEKLKQENFVLRENRHIQRISTELNCDFKDMLDMPTYEDLKSRIDKAIEYITNNNLHNFVYDNEELYEIISNHKAKTDLLNILQGSDKE